MDEVLYRPVTRQVLTEREMRAQVAGLKWPHYVYALCEPDGSIFYIGKGAGDRAFDHASEARRGGTSPKCQWIRYIGDHLRYSLLLACRDHAFAVGFEAGMLHNERGLLLNRQPARLSCIERMFDPVDETAQMVAMLLDVLRMTREMEQRCDEADAAMGVA